MNQKEDVAIKQKLKRRQSMTENNDQLIRRVVRDELSKNAIATGTNIYSRTQDLIRLSTTDVENRRQRSPNFHSHNTQKSTPLQSPSSVLQNNAPQQTSFTLPSTSFASPTDFFGHSSQSKKRSVPGHPARFLSSKNKKALGGSISKQKTLNVILFGQDLDGRERYKVDTNDELHSGLIIIKPHYIEDDVRREVVDLFKEKCIYMTENCFEFMKRDKNVLSKPLIGRNFNWSYENIKSLVGQGKLCCRLLVDYLSIIDANDEVQDVNNKKKKQKINIEPIDYFEEEQMCSSSMTQDEKLGKLEELFPEKSVDFLRSQLEFGNSLDETIILLSSQTNDSSSSGDDLLSISKPSCNDLPNVLTKLSQVMSDEKMKLKVDQEDILNDAISFYKGPEFDPLKRLQVQYRGQPAADTGGVMRQFFTDLLEEIMKLYFQGKQYKLPIYSASAVASGIFKYIGKIIVHSILQGGPGLKIFSTAVYEYIVNGDIDAIVEKIVLEDCSECCQAVVTKMMDMDDISGFDEVICMAEECGVTCSITNANKTLIVQNLIIHDVIGKRKVSLDHLRDGLKILNFGATLKRNVNLFQELFVVEGSVSKEKVIGVLRFPDEMTSEELLCKGYLLEFLNTCSVEILDAFLLFCTGARAIPGFGLGKIHVVFEKDISIFSSTCTNSITFPNIFENKNLFVAALVAVLDGHTFNCI